MLEGCYITQKTCLLFKRCKYQVKSHQIQLKKLNLDFETETETMTTKHEFYVRKKIYFQSCTHYSGTVRLTWQGMFYVQLKTISKKNKLSISFQQIQLSSLNKRQ